MEKKSWIAVIVCLIALAGLAYYLTDTTANATITIGHIGPLTGFVASYGEQETQGIDLAIAEINAKGGINGTQLAVIHEDDQLDPTLATNALNKLITADKVPAVIGELSSGITLALAPIAERNKVVLICADANSNKISSAGDYIFRIFPTNAIESKELVKLASSLNSTNSSILYINNDFGTDLEQSLNEDFTKNGGTITISEGYNPDATDFRTQLTKIKSKNPQIVFLVGYPNDMALVLKQAKEVGLTSQFIAPDTFNDPQIIELAGNATEGVMFVVPPTGGPLWEEFNQKIKNKYGSNATIVTAMNYDAVYLLAAAMKSNGFASEAIKTGLYQIQDYPGVTGNITFNKDGDVISRTFVPMIVEDRMFVEYGV